jgi:glycosyltransferase involved in cell wall biosynthesis
MKILFYKSVAKSDLVLTSSEPLRDKLSLHNKNILVIENGFDPELFRPLNQQKCRQILHISEDETVIGYFGSIAEHLGIKTLLSAAEILRKQIPDLRLLIAGHDGMNLDFKALDIDYRGFLPQQEIPVLINACDVVVIPYLPSKQVQQSNACKIAEYIACGVPIVATMVSNHKKNFSDAPRALCEPGNPESMASAILAQLKRPQLKKYSENLTWEKLAGKLSKAIESIVEK